VGRGDSVSKSKSRTRKRRVDSDVSEEEYIQDDRQNHEVKEVRKEMIGQLFLPERPPSFSGEQINHHKKI